MGYAFRQQTCDENTVQTWGEYLFAGLVIWFWERPLQAFSSYCMVPL